MDKKNKLTYSIIETAVDKGINDIEENAGRGIRNLLDLGLHFATGRFQKHFYHIAHQIIKNKNSSYYELVDNLIKNVDHKIIKHFGINLGYNSWTYGAKKIREYEKEYGYNIPWTIVFDFRNETKNMLTSREISDILDHGESLGIYSGMFFIEKSKAYFNDLLKVLSSHGDGAYFLYMKPEIITDELAYSVSQAGNILVSIALDTSGANIECRKAASKLLSKKCLYGTYSMYNDSNIKYIMSEDYTKQIYELNCTFAFLISKNNNKAQVNKNLSEFMAKARSAYGYPFLLFDFYMDLSSVDRTISVEDCFICIKSDGSVAIGNMDKINKNFNIRSHTLQYILKQALPKSRYV